MPRDEASAISPAYIGTTDVSMPTATPAINRPTISIAMFTEPACRAHPKHETQPPAKTARLRPRRSPVKTLMIVPNIAPPWNDETTPPVVVSLGLEKYLINSVWPIVEVIIPLS